MASDVRSCPSQVSGFMHINGKVFTRNDLKKMAAYVMQDDLMNAYMTGAG